MDTIAQILSIIGCLNWGLVGIFNFDLVAFIFGAGSLLARAIYVLVAIGAVVAIPMLLSDDANPTAGDM